ncbi:WD40 repeat-like protein [Neurospora crassa]|uniref:WD repeat containing protein 57 n=1 Tax=Neurospora crassa (strain ATCC 24698 / 74-OR23-1A / CBS 708.71 / DSM 1257 / FGSC 987) TaxID=367110 RepID=Q7S0G9_NEUCR|nr:WD repeat containing protein 57 [Neurospora crassa OR74A]EAA28805.1 WD repeat containing protein 57 [Neurospora crassa OR74A]KHE82044.1 WD40 repeat-like protein [Neurospora crassa]|eukprot:XP_958041.1 WD repeat containing protein 57 [Neurospora crassa OR74A]
MAAEVQPLATLKLPTVVSPITAEQRYWKSFKNQKSHTSTAAWPISHISFPGSSNGSAASHSLVAAAKTNDLFAVTSGPRVDIFSIRKRELLKTIGRFDSQAHSGEIRADGRVLVAGEDSGKMQVFDVGTGTRAVILKTWHVHKQPVWVTKWSPTELTTLMSCSDDKTVRLWDLPSNAPSRLFAGHQDYVRSGAFMPDRNNLLVSGSYDSTVRVWDARAPAGSVLTFKHADPIEEVLPLPGGTTLLAATGSAISVLDLVAAKPLRLITNHQKTVTSLSLASNGRRVVSGSLDGHVKVFETTNWNVVSGSKYPSPILSLSVVAAGSGHEDRHLAVGMQSGVLSLRTRLSGATAEKARARAAEDALMVSGASSKLAKIDSAKAKRKRNAASNKSMALLGENVDVIIPTDAPNSAGGRKRRVKLKPWQRDFREGRYAACLDAVLDLSSPEYQPVTALSVLVALRHRSALREALEGRDEVTVLPLLKWVIKYISDPRYATVCVDVAFQLFDIYSEYVGGSSELADQFAVMTGKVSREVEKAQMAIITNGMVESLMIGGAEA